MLITLIRQLFYHLKVALTWLGATSYGIRRGYIHRKSVIVFDDIGNQDEYQREVYIFAADYCKEQNITAVPDVGCGSAFKLLANFQNIPKAGVELNTGWLNQQYPNETWFEFSDPTWKKYPAQLIICADVIEHVPNPDAFIEDLLEHREAKYFVFSTPDRNLDTSPWKFGPPNNESHYREWTFEEFEGYVSRYFRVIHHSISNYEQRTQLLIAERKY
jgi:hypothetical protein